MATRGQEKFATTTVDEKTKQPTTEIVIDAIVAQNNMLGGRIRNMEDSSAGTVTVAQAYTTESTSNELDSASTASRSDSSTAIDDTMDISTTEQMATLNQDANSKPEIFNHSEGVTQSAEMLNHRAESSSDTTTNFYRKNYFPDGTTTTSRDESSSSEWLPAFIGMFYRIKTYF